MKRSWIYNLMLFPFCIYIRLIVFVTKQKNDAACVLLLMCVYVCVCLAMRPLMFIVYVKMSRINWRLWCSSSVFAVRIAANVRMLTPFVARGHSCSRIAASNWFCVHHTCRRSEMWRFYLLLRFTETYSRPSTGIVRSFRIQSAASAEFFRRKPCIGMSHKETRMPYISMHSPHLPRTSPQN